MRLPVSRASAAAHTCVCLCAPLPPTCNEAQSHSHRSAVKNGKTTQCLTIYQRQKRKGCIDYNEPTRRSAGCRKPSELACTTAAAAAAAMQACMRCMQGGRKWQVAPVDQSITVLIAANLPNTAARTLAQQQQPAVPTLTTSSSCCNCHIAAAALLLLLCNCSN